MVTDRVYAKQMPIETVFMQDIHAVFCNNLKRLRAERGLTQQDMADKLKYKHVQTYQELEYGFKTGVAWPTPDRIHKLAKALRCQPKEFFE